MKLPNICEITPPRDPNSEFTTLYVTEFIFETDIEADLDSKELMDEICNSLNIRPEQVDWRDQGTLWVHPLNKL